MSDPNQVQTQKIFNVEMTRVAIHFQSYSILTFYVDRLQEDKINQLFATLNEITKKEETKFGRKGLKPNDLIVITKNSKDFRVNVIQYSKRAFLDYQNLKNQVRARMAKTMMMVPMKPMPLFFTNQEGLKSFTEYYKETIIPTIDSINNGLKEYYNSDDYKKLIDTINKIAKKIETRKKTLTPLINYPQIYVENVFYDLSAPQYREYFANSLRKVLENFIIEVTKRSSNVQNFEIFKDKILREVKKLELFGFTGITDEVEKAINTKDIEHVRKAFGRIVDRFI